MHSILHGNCLALLPTIANNSIDAIVTDPPAGISFMGKEWDKDKGGRDHWIAWMQQVAAECLRCIKPGGHALVWALPRTSHWTATAWENAGWEVRDVVHHLFGSGFPKSLDVSKAMDKMAGHWRGRCGAVTVQTQPAKGTEYERTAKGEPITAAAQQLAGWGTALKPACENWILLRKPLIGTVAQNVLKHGTGGINVDACRVPTDDDWSRKSQDIDGNVFVNDRNRGLANKTNIMFRHKTEAAMHSAGRWPPNLLLDGSDEVVECFPQSTPAGSRASRNTADGMFGLGHDGQANIWHNDEGSAARFFPSLSFTDDERRILYCPKASRKDRAGSKHPTVKPIKLIEWLCKLITPPGGTILDPFAGSGTTGQAAINLGFDVIMIEREDEYYNDILKRVSWPPLPADAP